MFQSRRKLILLALCVPSALAALGVGTSAAAGSGPEDLQRYEVAMNGLSFFFEGPTNAAGAPANGTPFVVSGYIYPTGTFARHGDLSGVLPDGSPEFPGLVLGTWICRGWHLQDGDAVSGTVVATTQIFDLDPARPGARTIVSDGIEIADFHVPFERAVTGSTGLDGRVPDRHTQMYVGDGLNASGGFNTVFAF